VIRDRTDRARNLWLVDTNEWMLSTEWLRAHPISDDFGEQDWIANLAEDDKLLDRLRESNAKVECTARPTVRYYLGGYSNDFTGRHAHTERWLRPRESSIA
jgi:hypothetical protein